MTSTFFFFFLQNNTHIYRPWPLTRRHVTLLNTVTAWRKSPAGVFVPKNPTFPGKESRSLTIKMLIYGRRHGSHLCACTAACINQVCVRVYACYSAHAARLVVIKEPRTRHEGDFYTHTALRVIGPGRVHPTSTQ